MLLIWKSKSGAVLGRKRYDPDTTDVHEAIGETSWRFGPDETIEIHEDPVPYKDVLKTLTEYVHQTFRDMHDAYDINNGDICPNDNAELKTDIEHLAMRMHKILTIQKEYGDRPNE